MKQDMILRVFKSYCAVIRNSVGTEMFKNFYVSDGGAVKDIMNDGEFSCAFFVSSVLALFEYIPKPRATVDSTYEDLKKSGWEEISEPVEGSVLFWDEMFFEGDGLHAHVGFYIGDEQAISNDCKSGRVAQHHWTFNGEREVRAILWKEDIRKT
jgi:hypothetical protein